MKIKRVNSYENGIICDVVSIHLDTFKGFFLSFMGTGFLKQMYKSYCEYKDSGILVAFDDNDVPVGFLAYSGDLSGLYKHMIKKRLIQFSFFSFLAFLRKPKVFLRILRAFVKPSESKRSENYIELASLGVKTSNSSSGIGSLLIRELLKTVDFSKYSYISLETDAVNNESVNLFYQKNNFELARTFFTREGRKMNEYILTGEKYENIIYSQQCPESQ